MVVKQRWRLAGATIFKARDLFPAESMVSENFVLQEGVNVWTRKIAYSAAMALVS